MKIPTWLEKYAAKALLSKFTPWLVTSASAGIAVAATKLQDVAPDYVDPFLNPVAIGVFCFWAVSTVVQQLAAGPLKEHATSLQGALNDIASKMNLPVTPLKLDGLPLGKTENMGEKILTAIANK